MKKKRFFPFANMKNRSFSKIIIIYLPKKSHSAEKGVLSSPNAFFQAQKERYIFIKVKGVPFGQMNNYPKSRTVLKKTVGLSTII